MKTICQKTGLEFEGSARTKNHPEISKILGEANKYNAYKEVLEACSIVKGLQLNETEAISYLNDVMHNSHNEKIAQMIADKKAFKNSYKASQKEYFDSLRNGTYVSKTTDEEMLEIDDIASFNKKPSFKEPLNDL